jgi:TonB family protein
MISILAGIMLQAAAPLPLPPAPPAPPPALPPSKREPAVRTRASLGNLIGNDDYPAEALRRDEQGTVGFRLSVGADGRVTGCTVTSSSGSAILDSTTCRLMSERARFTPARDRKGRPVADGVKARIVWRIKQGSNLLPFETSMIAVTIRATPAGEVSCSIAVNGKPVTVSSCPEPPPSLAEVASATARTAEQTMVRIVLPAGAAEPADPADHGTQILESEAELGIAADGSIIECRVVRSEGRGPSAGRPDPPNPCAGYAPGRRPVFEPAAQAGPPRRATIRMRAYVRY